MRKNVLLSVLLFTKDLEKFNNTEFHNRKSTAKFIYRELSTLSNEKSLRGYTC